MRFVKRNDIEIENTLSYVIFIFANGYMRRYLPLIRVCDSLNSTGSIKWGLSVFAF